MRRIKHLLALTAVFAVNIVVAKHTTHIWLTPYLNIGKAGNTSLTRGGNMLATGITKGQYVAAGITVGIPINTNLSFGTGLGYSSSHFQYNHVAGAGVSNAGEATIVQHLRSLQLPLFLRYTAGNIGKCSFYAKGGMLLGISNNSSSTTTTKANYNTMEENDYDVEPGTSVSPFAETGVLLPFSHSVSIEAGVGGQYCGFVTRSMYYNATTHSYALYGHLGINLTVFDKNGKHHNTK